MHDPRMIARLGRTTSITSAGAIGAALVPMTVAWVGFATLPRILLLDEPAAGLPEHETLHLVDVIRRIPERSGALVIHGGGA